MSYRLVNVALELYSTAMLLIILICQLASRNRATRQNRLFNLAVALAACFILMDAVAWGFNKIPGTFYVVLTRPANFLVYSLGAFHLVALIAYIEASIHPDGQTARGATRAALFIFCIFFLLLVLSKFNGIVYSVDADNRFHWGPLYFLPHLFVAFFYLIIALTVLRNRKALGARNTATFLGYVLLPAVCTVINIFHHRLMFTYAAVALSLLIVFVNIQMQQEKRLQEKELEVLEDQVAIMMSQIQPHFLYNALSTVSDLCIIDPGQAQVAVLEFSSYLRANLDSLSAHDLIPFEKELDHVFTYLSLEKRRYEERLQIESAIGPWDFEVPPLSLQPIVENAVLHGVTARKEGGTVHIHTDETAAEWLVVVTDDGVGFDPAAPADSSRTHIGMDNVRQRLAALCGGRLDVASTPGGGTVATMHIPKHEGL